ncbi:MAG: cupin domain-containing protein [Bacteroidales bacterium]|nr:MAG: cupin domain-containing protein [Bacteroidales bacterium]
MLTHNNKTLSMVIKKSQRFTDYKINLKGGAGKIVIKHVLEKQEFTSSIRHFSDMIIASGCSIGKHKHINEEEIYVVREGKGYAHLNESEFILEAGDVMIVKDGDEHSITNIGDSDLMITAVISCY